MHDHPVSFLSIILSGGYLESREHLNMMYYHKWFNWISGRKEWYHKIQAVEPNTVTICFMSRKLREWGFHTDKGWVYWRDYYNNASRSNN